MTEGADQSHKSVVQQFLKKNKVKSGWQKLILESEDLTQELRENIIDKLDPSQDAPADNLIFNVFAHAEPGAIKVVIIGTSPAASPSIANGLAFSTDKYESQFEGTAGKSIRTVHKALRNAQILEKDVNYHCGHREWAEKGVLLLNAALTIPKGTEDPRNIKIHCEKWLKFLQGLLLRWITGTKVKNKLYVMRWGHKSHFSPNYAEKLWSEIKDKIEAGGVEIDIHTFPVIDHPTFPKQENKNNFLAKAPEHFKTINSHHGKIFDITNCDHEDLAQKMKGLKVQQKETEQQLGASSHV